MYRQTTDCSAIQQSLDVNSTKALNCSNVFIYNRVRVDL